MLDCATAVLDERQCECGLALKVFAALAANDDPAPILGESCVMLQQHGLADTAKASQSDVAREAGKCGEVRGKARQLGGPVSRVAWVQAHSGPGRSDAGGWMVPS